MGLNIKVANSCKLISIRAGQYDSTSTSASINIENLETGVSYTAVMNYTGGRGAISVPVSNLAAANGIFKACLSENGYEYVCKPILIKCNIDCCLTKLTNELIDCECDCAKCASSLAKAQKIFLLLESAVSAVEIAGASQSLAYYEEIKDKYLKAKEICDNSCGCDC